ncbi:MAG: TetR/AcrR family transcriptional regulator [Candidatus Bathyarchaeota archaeon]|nr:MAG: TetR/AcrR family transcriptional regulator [Candidatus Bathyarchaeota archaeon]
MRESKAKKRILEVADGMFKEVGYAALNVNEIAHEAEVSVGTLYYHFPEGKTSILMEIRRQMAERYVRDFEERLDSERLQESASFDEGLEMLLETLIEVHRENRLVLAAMDSEVLSNLVSYDRVAESVSVGGLMESDARPVIGVLETLMENHPEEGLTLDGRGARVNKVIDVLIHRFAYVESIFGSEPEFVEMITKIVRALLT